MTSEYILRNEKNEIIAHFRSNAKPKKIEKYLQACGNAFVWEDFLKFTNSKNIISANELNKTNPG